MLATKNAQSKLMFFIFWLDDSDIFISFHLGFVLPDGKKKRAQSSDSALTGGLRMPGIECRKEDAP